MTENEQKNENEQKKEYLNRYKKICIKLTSLEEQMKSIREVTESAKVQSITDMPRGSRQSDLSDYMVQMDELFTKIIVTRSERMKRLNEISNCIINMKDGIESTIIHKRYIEFKSWEQICVEINYCWKQTHRLHSRALRNFSITHDIE